METAEYRNIFSSEDAHFYYVAVHDCILQLIDKYVEQKKNLCQIQSQDFVLR
jgi:hypothetical protein